MAIHLIIFREMYPKLSKITFCQCPFVLIHQLQPINSISKNHCACVWEKWLMCIAIIWMEIYFKLLYKPALALLFSNRKKKCCFLFAPLVVSFR